MTKKIGNNIIGELNIIISKGRIVRGILFIRKLRLEYLSSDDIEYILPLISNFILINLLYTRSTKRKLALKTKDSS